MNIVSGHQRVAILDSLERTKDYKLTVSLVDLSEKEEIEQNLFFNNSKAQGEYDPFLLAELFEYNDLNIDATGFDLPDLGVLGVEVDLQVGDAGEDPEEKELLQLNGQIYDQSRELRKAISGYTKDENKGDNSVFVVLTFSSEQNKADFLKQLGFHAEDKYLKGEVVHSLIGKS